MGKWIGFGLLGVFALFLVSGCSLIAWGVGINNQIVRLDQTAQEKASQVQNVYQRRSDLIGNLVETVKGYAGHEKSTLTDVIQARAGATGIKLTPEALKDPEALKRFKTAQDGMSSALSRLMVSVERYPELKADKNFMELQRQLTATENRIMIERQRFNYAVQAYNTRLKLFPGNLLAGYLGYQPKIFFEADADAKAVPKVKF